MGQEKNKPTFYLLRATPSPVAVPRPSVRVRLPANIERAVQAFGIQRAFAIPTGELDRLQGRHLAGGCA